MSEQLTPWRVAPAGITTYIPSADIVDARGRLVCDVAAADVAAFIVAACNSHAALLQAAEAAERQLFYCLSTPCVDCGQGHDVTDHDMTRLTALRAAIAAARTVPDAR